MNDRWHPAPQSLIDDATAQRWTKEQPAPDLVGFLVVFARLNTPSPWTARKLATWAGWSRWKANQTITAAKQWANAWNGNSGHSTQQASGHPLPTIPNTYSTNPASFRPLSGQFPDITRADLHVQNTTRHNYPSNEGSPANAVRPGSVSSGSGLEIPNGSGSAVPSGNDSPAELDTKSANTQPRKRRKKAPAIAYKPLWEYLEGVRIANTPNAKETQIGRRKTDLRLRVTEHGEEAVKHAWRWLWESNHERARWLRENGHATYSTFLRASKCQQYVDFSREWDPAVDTSTDAVDVFNLPPEAFDADGNIIDFKTANRSSNHGN